MTLTRHKRPGTPYADGRIRLEEYDVEGHDGESHLRTVIRHPSAVVLLACLPGDQVVLVRNFRLALGKELLELPAGCLEPGEVPLDAAARELAEETGYRAGKLTPLLSFYPSPGLLDERMDVFIATELSLGERKLDPTEEMNVEVWPFTRLLDAIDGGEVIDAKTIAAALFWARTQAKEAGASTGGEFPSGRNAE